MENRDLEILQWLADAGVVQKGGPGSGRKPEEGSLSDVSARLAAFVTKNRTNLSPMDAKNTYVAHMQLSGEHAIAAQQLTGKEAALHEKAADAHEKAADLVLRAQGEWGGRLGLDEKPPTASQVSAASKAAAKASAACAESDVPLPYDIPLPGGAPSHYSHYYAGEISKGGPGSGPHAGVGRPGPAYYKSPNSYRRTGRERFRLAPKPETETPHTFTTEAGKFTLGDYQKKPEDYAARFLRMPPSTPDPELHGEGKGKKGGYSQGTGRSLFKGSEVIKGGPGSGRHPEGGENLTASGHRPIHEIAREIESDWGGQGKGVNFAARPYLDAMHRLTDAKDHYIADSARSVITYFLSNASGWKGEKAKAIKAELKKIAAKGSW